MRHLTKIAVIFAAAGLSLSAILPSNAQSMAASAALNVRIGPGLEHAVVDTLFKGERVMVDFCEGDWCRVTHSGPDGWVHASYLQSATFSQSWSATSRDLPATLPNDTAPETQPDIGVNIDLTPRPCNRPRC